MLVRGRDCRVFVVERERNDVGVEVAQSQRHTMWSLSVVEVVLVMGGEGGRWKV